MREITRDTPSGHGHSSRLWTRWIPGIAAIACMAGCSAAAAGGETATTDVEEASRAAPDDAHPFYATVRRDETSCAPSARVFVRAVGASERREIPVSELDVHEAGLDPAGIAAVRTAPDRDLLLYGRLGSPHPTTGARPFVVAAAYRGMPGVHARRGDALFRVEAAAACDDGGAATPRGGRTEDPPNLRAMRIDGPATPIELASLTVSSAARSGVDPSWLERRVVAHGAIVAAHPSHLSSTRAPVGAARSSRLDASQVFVRLSDAVGACPELSAIRCPDGETPTYERSADRCLVPTGCVVRAMCPAAVPACEEGYTLASWPAAPSGCPRYACDPSFLVESSPPIAPRAAPVVDQELGH